MGRRRRREGVLDEGGRALGSMKLDWKELGTETEHVGNRMGTERQRRRGKWGRGGWLLRSAGCTESLPHFRIQEPDIVPRAV